MALQITPEQEQRIRAIVKAGVYSSAEEALDAAAAGVEIAAAPGFEGGQEELEALLMEGPKKHDPPAGTPHPDRLSKLTESLQTLTIAARPLG